MKAPILQAQPTPIDGAPIPQAVPVLALFEGVPTAALETALPKKGGAVCVVLGPHRNRRGTLLERVSADDRAVVQLGGDFQIVECTFEQVAEWTGPAGDGLDDDLVG